MLQNYYYHRLPRLETLNSTVQENIIKLDCLQSEEEVGKAAASVIIEQVRKKANSVFLLPTGRTPVCMYAYLADKVDKGELNLDSILTFNLDEFYGIEAKHPGSYHSYMSSVFFKPARIPLVNSRLLNSAANNPFEECARYEHMIGEMGGIDLAILGIGVNGHIGFNEPGSSFSSRTRLVSLRDESRAANAFLFGNDPQKVPKEAMTVGMATIMEARKIVLLATGYSKAQAVAAMLRGPIRPILPASLLQLHADVTVLADPAAISIVND